MDFKIMKCPVCGSPLDAGPDEKYIICRACDTPLRLNEDATSFLRDPEAFGYGFEKGRQRAKAEEEQRRSGERGSYYEGEPSYRQAPPGTRYQSQGYYNQPAPNQPYPSQMNYNFYAGVDPTVSDKDRWTALIVCFFLGFVGGHQFYVGRIGKGILYFFTGGLFFFGWFIDIIRLLTGTFTDSNGRVLVSQKQRMNRMYVNPYDGMPQQNYDSSPQRNYGGTPQRNNGSRSQRAHRSQPDYSHPWYNHPGNNQPEFSQSDYTQSGSTQSGSTRSGFDQPGYGQGDYSQPSYGQGGYSQSNYGQGGYSQSNYGQGDYSQPGYSSQNYSQSGHNDHAEWERKARRRRKIFLALTILFGISMLGNLFDGEFSNFVIMAIFTGVFAHFYYKTPKT